MGKYQNSIAEYNFNKLIRYYKDAINSAQTSDEARGIAQALEGVLAQRGQGLADVQGLNTDKLTGNQAGLEGLDPGKAAKQARKEQYKPMFKDLEAEFNVASNKDGDWAKAAKENENVRILDKNGQDVTQTFNGDKLKGYTLEINSQKYGKVQIQPGGDGNINGGDDKILMVGGQAAAGNMMAGLQGINNPTQQAGLLNPLAGIMGLNPTEQAAAEANQYAMQPGMFSEAQIKSLIAAILNQSLASIEQKEYLQQFNVA